MPAEKRCALKYKLVYCNISVGMKFKLFKPRKAHVSVPLYFLPLSRTRRLFFIEKVHQTVMKEGVIFSLTEQPPSCFEHWCTRSSSAGLVSCCLNFLIPSFVESFHITTATPKQPISRSQMPS